MTDFPESDSTKIAAIDGKTSDLMRLLEPPGGPSKIDLVLETVSAISEVLEAMHAEQMRQGAILAAMKAQPAPGERQPASAAD